MHIFMEQILRLMGWSRPGLTVAFSALSGSHPRQAFPFLKGGQGWEGNWGREEVQGKTAGGMEGETVVGMEYMREEWINRGKGKDLPQSWWLFTVIEQWPGHYIIKWMFWCSRQNPKAGDMQKLVYHRDVPLWWIIKIYRRIYNITQFMNVNVLKMETLYLKKGWVK